VANQLRVALEIGPKGKRVVAVAPDWPGLERGATTEQAAIERVRAYLPRYAPVAVGGGLASHCSSPGWAQTCRVRVKVPNGNLYFYVPLAFCSRSVAPTK
jgi:hypothetical protein